MDMGESWVGYKPVVVFGSTEEREVRTGGRRREWKEGLYCNVMTETFLV